MIIAILVDVKWHLITLIAISFMTHGGEQVFMCLWAICLSFLEKCLFKSFAHLDTWFRVLAGVA